MSARRMSSSDGTFKGTIHGNVVKLQSTAMVEGEVYNRSLAIDQNANFEGRRPPAVRSPVEAPLDDQIAVKPSTPALVPEQPTTTAYAYANGGNGHATHDGGNMNSELPNGQTSNY
ncbi:polymer-forming cytoskeletal protein [Pseudolabrys sp. FHR47]|uniref:polymer-forming cytoskeletal protein n=1 Tax=Pseudolabrys sp. FHR47 TaxID=2562284 RepID=UPI001FEEF183|nr:polymer-forming cytoskeletal protein [Pseudolabrys sp. FHR47]